MYFNWNILTQDFSYFGAKSSIKDEFQTFQIQKRACQTIPTDQNFEKLKDGGDLSSGRTSKNLFKFSSNLSQSSPIIRMKIWIKLVSDRCSGSGGWFYWSKSRKNRWWSSDLSIEKVEIPPCLLKFKKFAARYFFNISKNYWLLGRVRYPEASTDGANWFYGRFQSI